MVSDLYAHENLIRICLKIYRWTCYIILNRYHSASLCSQATRQALVTQRRAGARPPYPVGINGMAGNTVRLCRMAWLVLGMIQQYSSHDNTFHIYRQFFIVTEHYVQGAVHHCWVFPSVGWLIASLAGPSLANRSTDDYIDTVRPHHSNVVRVVTTVLFCRSWPTCRLWLRTRTWTPWLSQTSKQVHIQHSNRENACIFANKLPHCYNQLK